MLRNCISKLRAPGLVRCINTSRSLAAKSDVQTETIAIPRVEKSLNQVVLLGRVGTRPQLRGSKEHPVTVFTLATHTHYKQSSGETQQKTEWHRISVFKPYLRDTVYKYLTKGQRALIQGKLMYGQITDAAGTAHTTTTIAADDVIFFNKTETETADDEEDEFA